MSQFDYPRIHFSGKTTIDPATGNNNYHFPLVCYEPDSGTVVLPPRIYITSDIASCLVKDLESKMISLLKDEDGDLYIPILPISTPELFKEWMITPIGSHTGDSNYHWIYDRISTQKENKKLASIRRVTFTKIQKHRLSQGS